MSQTPGLDTAADLTPERRAHVEGRLQHNLISWLATVDPDGQPHTVPVWFLWRADGTVLTYTRAGKAKLRNLRANPRVALALDVTDIGRDPIRIEGVASLDEDVPPADQNPDYLAKYAERIGALFGSAAEFAAMFSVPIVITPARILA